MALKQKTLRWLLGSVMDDNRLQIADNPMLSPLLGLHLGVLLDVDVVIGLEGIDVVIGKLDTILITINIEGAQLWELGARGYDKIHTRSP